MKKFVALLIMCPLFAFAQQMTLQEAIAKKAVQIKAAWISNSYYGYGLQLTINNLQSTNLKINVEPGTFFYCDDPQAQDQVVVEPLLFALKPKENSTQKLYTNCTEPTNYGPYSGTGFRLLPEQIAGDEKIRALVAQLKEFTDFKEISQNVIWSLRMDKPFYYTIEDSTKHSDIFAILKDYLKLDRQENYGKPKPRFLFASRSNVAHYLSKSSKITLELKDENNNVVKQFYKNRDIMAGLHAITVAYNSIVEDSSISYKLVVSNDLGEVLLNKEIRNNTMDGKMLRCKLPIIIAMDLKSDLKGARLDLLDSEGNLMVNLYKNRDLKLGNYRTPYTIYHVKPKNTIFKMILKDSAGNIIFEQEYDGNKSDEIRPELK